MYFMKVSKMKYILDIEANGLLDTVTDITIAHIRSVETNKGKLFKNGYELVRYVEYLLKHGNIIICHNLQYDIGVLYKLYDFNMFKYFRQFRDTMIITQIIYPKKLLMKKFNVDKYSLSTLSKLTGKVQKQEYNGRYDIWSKELQEYLLYDTESTKDLYLWLKKQKPYPSTQVIELEIFNTLVSSIYSIYGWKVNTNLFNKQYQSFVSKRIKIDMKLSDKFLPLWTIDKSKKIRPHTETINVPRSFKNLLGIPKVRVDYKRLSKRPTKKFIKTLKEYPYRVIKVKYTKYYTNIKLVYFNPNSRQSVIKFMRHKFNTHFYIVSKTNNYKLDKDVFKALIKKSTIPQEKEILELLLDRFTTSKIISEYESIHKLIVDGRIHSNFHVLGASNTGRSCLPTSIRIKTPTGYKYQHELNIGDEVYAYDRFKKKEVITKVNAIHSYKDTPTGRFTNGKVSYRCTSNHKWVVGSKLIEACKITKNMEILLYK